MLPGSSDNDGATGYLTYNFQVLGGTAGAPVTVDVTSLLQWTIGDPSNFAFSRIIFDFGGLETQKTICTDGGCSGAGCSRSGHSNPGRGGGPYVPNS